ncbi:unnamed protein product [Amoebophrya sp. A120]|nr:unnamed protein product [Amoebophrya sp. A120]|eukprot:GSA120T00001757001.1
MLGSPRRGSGVTMSSASPTAAPRRNTIGSALGTGTSASLASPPIVVQAPSSRSAWTSSTTTTTSPSKAGARLSVSPVRGPQAQGGSSSTASPAAATPTCGNNPSHWRKVQTRFGFSNGSSQFHELPETYEQWREQKEIDPKTRVFALYPNPSPTHSVGGALDALRRAMESHGWYYNSEATGNRAA